MNKATSKRNAMNATTKKEQQIAKRIAALPPDSDERAEMEGEITNPWVFDLIEAIEEEQEETAP